MAAVDGDTCIKIFAFAVNSISFDSDKICEWSLKGHLGDG